MFGRSKKSHEEKIADMRIHLDQQYNRGRSEYIFGQLDDLTIIMVERNGPDFQKLTAKVDIDKIFAPESK